MKHILTLPLLLVSTLALTACPSKNKSNKPTTTKITILGDPREVIHGAYIRPDVSALKDGESLYLVSQISFVEEDSYSTGPNNILEENKTAGRENSNKGDAENYVFKVRVLGPQNVQLKNPAFDIEIEKQGHTYIANSDDPETTHQLLHTSVSADLNTISLLFFDKNKISGKRELTALYFARSPYANLKRTDKKFEYLQGTGVKIGWAKNKTVDIRVCNSDSQLLNSKASESFDAWKTVLNGKLNVNYLGTTNQYPPFSDLNFRCIYLVSSYMSEPNPDIHNYAVTGTVPNLNTSEITDSDMLVFQQEFAKSDIVNDPYEFSNLLTRVILHELGHFFGLGHQFNGTKSIMSYNMKGVPNIEQHDKDAIAELYN